MRVEKVSFSYTNRARQSNLAEHPFLYTSQNNYTKKDKNRIGLVSVLIACSAVLVTLLTLRKL